MAGSLVRAVLAGFLIGGVVHVVAILSIPAAAQNDAVDRVHRAAVARSVTTIPADGTVLPDLDPFFVHAVCPFNLVNGPLQVSGTMPGEVWTLAVVSESNGVVASLERASVLGGDLDLIVGGVASIERLRLSIAGSGRDVVFAETPIGRGFVLLRSFVGEGQDRDAVRRSLAAVECGNP